MSIEEVNWLVIPIESSLLLLECWTCKRRFSPNFSCTLVDFDSFGNI